ncbi:hypothetical protein PF621_gp32 [Salmonella phage vB_SenTO17]|uniref:Uncharacterized protein n=1 Tax=Salmonella phage vB_SenTO17 TaxID=2732254 RepID=A0A7G3T3G7_9CAUD|nr:hypothetical protein PF621_gp32 [Salmonella phage vB_SenTO17]QJQ80415.1 hypothetical protein vBSenTO17_32 [Salmonella phage vB_SenTO17]
MGFPHHHPSRRLIHYALCNTATKMEVSTGSAKNNVGCYLQS